MILLDTNVVSERFRPEPAKSVLDWFVKIADTPLYLSSVTEAELLRGVADMPEGKAKGGLSGVVTQLLRVRFEGFILAFDSSVAVHYAELFTSRKRSGRPISQFDCMIAATARAHGFKVATRDITGFDGCGVEIINPWI